MPNNTSVIERTLDFVEPSGGRTTVTISFGPTYPVDDDYRCPVTFTGWQEKPPPDIWGFDSLQALLLAISLVHSMLVSFVEQGGRVLYAGTEDPFDLDGFLTPKYVKSI